MTLFRITRCAIFASFLVLPTASCATSSDNNLNTASAVQAESGQPVSAALNRLFEDYWQDYLRLNPELSLSHGDFSHEDKFDNSLENAWRDERLAMLHKYSAALQKYNPETLSEQDRISYEMLTYQLKRDLGFYGSHLFEMARMIPTDQFQGLHLVYAREAAGSGDYPFKTVNDYDNALKRADNYARWTDEAISRMREGMVNNIVLPRIVVERVIPQLKARFGIKPEKSEFWKPVADMPKSISARDRARLTQAYRKKIADVIEPAYRRMYTFMKKEYLPKARTTVGLGGLKGGKALYDYYVRYHTTTNMTPRQIHELGISEVNRIMDEFAKLQKKVGVKGSLQDFFNYVRHDPHLHFRNGKDVIAAFRADRRRIEPLLPKLFNVLPKAKYEIRPMPESSKAFQGNGNYAPAGANGSRPGILWINTHAAGVRDKFNVMTLSLHEGLPGHHFQTSIAQEVKGLPSFRRFDFTNAYGEGWALYAESLGRELGVFDDPWQYYGHLNYDMMRANRLVIDTGIHAMGWTVDQGVKWMMDHSSMTEQQARDEVERYVAYPGQALSYKIGQLKIRALRTKAEKALGDKFDVREFHDQVLLGGSMPLAILEQKIDRWIAKKQGTKTVQSGDVLTDMFAWWNASYKTSGAFTEAGFAKYYTPDAAIYMNGEMRAQGIPAITRHFRKMQGEADKIEIILPFEEEFKSGNQVFTYHLIRTLAQGKPDCWHVMGYAKISDGKISLLNFESVADPAERVGSSYQEACSSHYR